MRGLGDFLFKLVLTTRTMCAMELSRGMVTTRNRIVEMQIALMGMVELYKAVLSMAGENDEIPYEFGFVSERWRRVRRGRMALSK